uniref:Uncharacterized protein n=1 Tax=Zea mays TaxID=4577 RepID=A0A804MCJ4_MAIZE
MPVLRSPFAGGDLPAGDADPDYLYFLEHIRIDGDSYTLELPSHGDSPPSLIKYETPFASPSDGECVSDPSDGQLVLEIGGVVVNYDNPVAVESPGEKDTQRGEEAVFASPGEGISVAAGSDQVASGAPATAVSEQNASDWRADPSPRREVNDGGDEGLSDASALKGAYWEASSSDGRRAPPTNSGGKVEKELGIIWPTHITRRPDSDFKRRLIKALTKPVARKEYYRLFDTVTIRTPLMKLRQVRNETKFYPTEEMGSSYLDHYPDLAEQIMNNGRRNGLALMRGFLFWLQVA